jgi:DNA processing protein
LLRKTFENLNRRLRPPAGGKSGEKIVVRDRTALLAINRLGFLKTGEKLLLSEHFGTMEGLRKLSRSSIEEVLERKVERFMLSADELASGAEALDEELDSLAVRPLFYGDSAYPPQLREIYDPPFALFCRGSLPEAWEIPCVAIVGTRNPSGLGRTAAHRMGFEFGSHGIPVVSGLARGIDSEAHRGALDSLGPCIAVLGHGPDTVHPATNRGLAVRIMEQGGVILSEYEPGTPALRHHFPARNRIISGLSRAVLVVQAPARSGALITADYALEQGRDLFVHSGCLEGSAGEGCRRLVEDGASAVASAAQILGEWFRGGNPAGAGAPVSGTGVLFDETRPGQALADMLELELSGSAIHHQGDYLRRTVHGS